jgi:hypothetical protein
VGQQERREVVDGEAQLVTVPARGVARLATPTRPDAGVVHQHVQTIVVGHYLVGQPVDLFQRGEVGQVIVEIVVAGLFADLAHRGFATLEVAAVQQYGRPRGGQVARRRLAEPVRRAGHQDHRFVYAPHDYSSLDPPGLSPRRQRNAVTRRRTAARTPNEHQQVEWTSAPTFLFFLLNSL